MEWISVRERLPCIGQLCIFLLETKEVCAGRFNGNDEWEIGCKCVLAHDQGDYTVTYWMELPEPPKG